MRRCGHYCGPGCLCVCRDNRLAGCCRDNRLAGGCVTITDTTANVDSNIINLNQHYDDDNPYDSQFDSLRTLSGFLH